MNVLFPWLVTLLAAAPASPANGAYTLRQYMAIKRANDLFSVVKSGKVKIETTARYKLEEAANAHRDLEGRKTTGSVILIP